MPTTSCATCSPDAAGPASAAASECTGSRTPMTKSATAICRGHARSHPVPSDGARIIESSSAAPERPTGSVECVSLDGKHGYLTSPESHCTCEDESRCIGRSSPQQRSDQSLRFEHKQYGGHRRYGDDGAPQASEHDSSDPGALCRVHRKRQPHALTQNRGNGCAGDSETRDEHYVEYGDNNESERECTQDISLATDRQQPHDSNIAQHPGNQRPDEQAQRGCSRDIRRPEHQCD